MFISTTICCFVPLSHLSTTIRCFAPLSHLVRRSHKIILPIIRILSFSYQIVIIYNLFKIEKRKSQYTNKIVNNYKMYLGTLVCCIILLIIVKYILGTSICCIVHVTHLIKRSHKKLINHKIFFLTEVSLFYNLS